MGGDIELNRSRTVAIAGGALLIVALVLAAAGWSLRSTHSASDDALAAPNTTAAMTVSPYQLLSDPSQYRKPNETILGGGAGAGTNQFSLAKLSPSATHLILRWDCSGAGTWQEYLDGVLYSSSACARNTLGTADLPLRQPHPKLMRIQAPSGMYWKVSITEIAGVTG